MNQQHLFHIRVVTCSEEEHTRARKLFDQAVSLLRVNGLDVQAVTYPINSPIDVQLVVLRPAAGK